MFKQCRSFSCHCQALTPQKRQRMEWTLSTHPRLVQQTQSQRKRRRTTARIMAQPAANWPLKRAPRQLLFSLELSLASLSLSLSVTLSLSLFVFSLTLSLCVSVTLSLSLSSLSLSLVLINRRNGPRYQRVLALFAFLTGVIPKGLILRKFCVWCLCMFCFM